MMEGAINASSKASDLATSHRADPMNEGSPPSHWRAAASALSWGTKATASVLSADSLSGRLIVIARLDDLASCAVKAWVRRTGTASPIEAAH